MKKSVKNTVCLISLCLAIALSVSSSVFASSDRGSAIYRDKITGGFWASTNGHAGMMVQAYSTDSSPVTHIVSGANNVTNCDWDYYLNGGTSQENEFKGVYYPSGITSSQRTLCLLQANKLLNKTKRHPMDAFDFT